MGHGEKHVNRAGRHRDPTTKLLTNFCEERTLDGLCPGEAASSNSDGCLEFVFTFPVETLHHVPQF